MRSDNTTKVYGRSRASLTIHTVFHPDPRGRYVAGSRRGGSLNRAELAGRHTRFPWRRDVVLDLLPVGRSNTAGWQQREEPMSARRATIRRNLGQAIKPSVPPVYMLPGNPLKVEVAALTAVGV